MCASVSRLVIMIANVDRNSNTVLAFFLIEQNVYEENVDFVDNKIEI